MNILETYYTYAKLSQAAYIDLSGVADPLNSVEIVNAASSSAQERVPLELANNIFGVGDNNTNPADTWTMLSPYYKTGSWLGSSTGHSDPTSGFAGMLLSNPIYGKVLAIAGTEPTNGALKNLTPTCSRTTSARKRRWRRFISSRKWCRLG